MECTLAELRTLKVVRDKIDGLVRKKHTEALRDIATAIADIDQLIKLAKINQNKEV
jgi:DNA mismatch repair ATPase MutS